MKLDKPLQFNITFLMGLHRLISADTAAENRRREREEVRMSELHHRNVERVPRRNQISVLDPAQTIKGSVERQGG